MAVKMVGLALAERVPVTGGYGAAVVSGEAGMATAGSPQGVEVPVPGTGQAMTLGRDSRFAFSGVPAGVAGGQVRIEVR